MRNALLSGVPGGLNEGTCRRYMAQAGQYPIVPLLPSPASFYNQLKIRGVWHVAGTRDVSLEEVGCAQAPARPEEAECWITELLSFSKGHLPVTVQGDRRLPHQAASKNNLPSCSQHWHTLRASSWRWPCPGSLLLMALSLCRASVGQDQQDQRPGERQGLFSEE